MKLKSTRIVFKYKAKLYKFISFFVDKKDNSFYFHTYEEADQNLKSLNFTWQENQPNLIDFGNIKEHDFQKNKLSFHESGFIHTTDKLGKRLKDNVVGIPFHRIETSLHILFFAPKQIDTLVEHEKTENQDLIIELPNDIKPFTLHFDVYRKSQSDNLEYNNPDLLINGYVFINYDNKEFGLRMYLQKVLDEAPWPPFSFNLIRIG